jgi:hypothetical protein
LCGTNFFPAHKTFLAMQNTRDLDILTAGAFTAGAISLLAISTGRPRKIDKLDAVSIGGVLLSTVGLLVTIGCRFFDFK